MNAKISKNDNWNPYPSMITDWGAVNPKPYPMPQNSHTKAKGSVPAGGGGRVHPDNAAIRVVPPPCSLSTPAPPVFASSS